MFINPHVIRRAMLLRICAAIALTPAAASDLSVEIGGYQAAGAAPQFRHARLDIGGAATQFTIQLR